MTARGPQKTGTHGEADTVVTGLQEKASAANQHARGQPPVEQLSAIVSAFTWR